MSIVSNHYPEVLDELNGVNGTGTAAPEQPARRTPRSPRPKPTRTVRLLSVSHGLHELPAGATVQIDMTTTGPRIGDRVESFRYFVTPLASDFGRAFRVRRLDTGDTYDVCLNGPQSSCECKGHLRHGCHEGRFCKHISGLQALVNLGKL